MAWEYLFALVGTFVLAAGLTRICCNPASLCHVLDHPNPRSLHARPTPRAGGVAFLLAIAAAWIGQALLVVPPQELGWLGTAALLLAVVNLWDDVHGVRPRYRLLVQVLAAVAIIYGGMSLGRLALPGWTWELAQLPDWILSLGFIVWMTNLYNFMDGMDGLAGGMAIAGFGALAGLGLLGGAAGFGFLNGAIAAAVAGFLVWNLPPARIFMGDVGSSTLGFLAAGMSLWGARSGLFPVWAPLLIFSPFLFDATLTLLRRLLAGERVWEAHRSHFYQRLVTAGWGQRRTLVAAYALILASALSGVALPPLPLIWQLLGLGAWLLVYLSIALAMRSLGSVGAEKGVAE